MFIIGSQEYIVAKVSQLPAGFSPSSVNAFREL
jgi:hypothetical protein